MALQEWHIQSRATACAVSGRKFVEGEKFVSALYWREGAYVRVDMAPEAWEARNENVQPLSYWQSAFTPAPPAPPEPMKKDDAAGLLRKLMEQGSPEHRNVRYILALMLERKRILRPLGAQAAGPDRKLLVYEHLPTGETWLIEDPELKLQDLIPVQDEVADLIDRETNPNYVPRPSRAEIQAAKAAEAAALAAEEEAKVLAAAEKAAKAEAAAAAKAEREAIRAQKDAMRTEKEIAQAAKLAAEEAERAAAAEKDREWREANKEAAASYDILASANAAIRALKEEDQREVLSYYEFKAQLLFSDSEAPPEPPAEIDPERERAARQEEGKFAMDLLGAMQGRRVLELACGDGNSTAIAAMSAKYILATDLAPSLLKFAGQRGLPADKVEFLQRDAFKPASIPGYFDAAMMTGFFQHIAREKRDEFFASLEQKLGARAIVFISGTMWAPGSASIATKKGKSKDTYLTRTLTDGSEFLVLDNEYGEEELRSIFSPRTTSLEMFVGEQNWWVKYVTQ